MANGHRNNITNMLGLKGFKVSDTREEEDAFVIEVHLNPTRQQFVPSVTQEIFTDTAKPNQERCCTHYSTERKYILRYMAGRDGSVSIAAAHLRRSLR